ncbi:hypothetical protein N480_18355 [Pseudoalteromonas luteoviolacea S2607]|uniref:nucleotidyltransferase domain-containing protein n=1 Tax=Pseudoalteromonas luteoviolacea TaxID=43657 RepID=UPI0007B04048|nr:nucleotidyltransferase domain-containing protein [Pseudoalteromonas luteoviolacea]KZN35953.1 hypothetical protein N480_18355 [Pseudoalteromonas luteoviolacea S2607]
MDLSLNHIKKQHMPYFQEAVAYFERSINIEAILGHGSYFNGRFTENSDIDLIILSKSDSYEKTIINIGGIDFEVMHINIRRLMKIMEFRASDFTRSVSDSSLVFDKNGFGQKVITKAQTHCALGSSLVDDMKYINQSRSLTRTLLFDLKDALDDPMSFQLMHIQLIQLIYRFICLEEKSWEKSSKKVFKDIKTLRPNTYKKIQTSLKESDLSIKLDIIEDLITESLAPFGGILNNDETFSII